jgi:hypothetical protein
MDRTVNTELLTVPAPPMSHSSWGNKVSGLVAAHRNLIDVGFPETPFHFAPTYSQSGKHLVTTQRNIAASARRLWARKFFGRTKSMANMEYFLFYTYIAPPQSNGLSTTQPARSTQEYSHRPRVTDVKPF